MGESVDSARVERVAREKLEQARWRLRATGGKLDWFAALVDNEFVSAEQQQANAAQRLKKMLTFASTHIPYYRDVFTERGLAVDDVGSVRQLPLLPELSKHIIMQQGKRLRPLVLPGGQKFAGSHASSGSTGKPVRVYQTDHAWFMRILLAQRQLRWYRYDPMLSLGAVRLARNLPRLNGKILEAGETVTQDSWPGLGKFFITGPFLGFDIDNTLEQTVDWLEHHQPAYFQSFSGALEHLAFAFQGRSSLAGLQGIRAMSEPMSKGQQARIESTFSAPVHMSYGLDETGWLATRCREGGRYHVHTEHCLVEIVDKIGEPCRPGEYGRVLVTILSNVAMPLLRYDTDDFAQAVAGPCACGRTLPGFGDIVGRHSLTDGLPEGTLTIVANLRAAMDALPVELSRPLREYQIRQSLDGDFQLCLVLAGSRHPDFDNYVAAAFRAVLVNAEVAATQAPGLTISEVRHIPRSSSKKFFHFVSEFTQPGLAKDRVAMPEMKS